MEAAGRVTVVFFGVTPYTSDTADLVTLMRMVPKVEPPVPLAVYRMYPQ